MHRIARVRKPKQFKVSLQGIPQEAPAQGEFDFAALCSMRLQDTLHRKPATSCHFIPVQDSLDDECATSGHFLLFQDDSLYRILAA